MELEKQIRKYLMDNLLYVDDDLDYEDDTSLIKEGLVDSMGVMELVAYVQSAFGISIAQRDVIPDNFDSVNKIASFVRRNREAAEKKESRGALYAGPGRVAKQQAQSAR